MNKRRDFIKKSVLGGLATTTLMSNTIEKISLGSHPKIISTWNHGLSANIEAWKEL